MIALALTSTLFLFWGLIGHAVLCLLYPWRPKLETLLLSPVVGVATAVLLVFVLNRAGLAVRTFGLYLAVALLAVGLVFAWRQRQWPNVPLLISFGGLLGVAMLLTGRPM